MNIVYNTSAEVVPFVTWDPLLHLILIGYLVIYLVSHLATS